MFKRVMARATENGDLVHFDAIGDYSLADDMENGKLCSYEFDLLPAVNFGGSEGIYIDCSLLGKFDESGRKALHIGTLKTLDTGLKPARPWASCVESCSTMKINTSTRICVSSTAPRQSSVCSPSRFGWSRPPPWR